MFRKAAKVEAAALAVGEAGVLPEKSKDE